MLRRISEELEQFSDAIRIVRERGAVVEEAAEDVYLLRSAQTNKLNQQKDIALAVMGLTHGNEVAGVSALTDWLRSMASQARFPEITVAVILGNVKAARLNQRFCERDLNRSFNRNETGTWEDRRARELEKILQRTSYLVDLHQTILPSVSPFFIFPYKPESYAWAREINPRLPIVTHWGVPFSADGCCTDEYLNDHCGGVGVTIELGQNGFNPALVAAGSLAVQQAVATVTRRFKNEAPLPASGEPEIYTWAASLPYPADGEGLRPGYINFQDVKAGERLGGSNKTPLISSHDGKILFPKYPPKDSPRPAEVCRIIRRIKAEELGKAEL